MITANLLYIFYSIENMLSYPIKYRSKCQRWYKYLWHEYRVKYRPSKICSFLRTRLFLKREREGEGEREKEETKRINKIKRRERKRDANQK